MSLITDEQLDALQEFINIGIGRSAAMLNEMVESPIALSVPTLQVFKGEALQRELIGQFNGHRLAAVRLNFSGSFSGSAELVFPTESASALVALLTGEDSNSPDLDAVKIGTLTEVGNIVINGVLGSISNLLKRQMTYTLPTYSEDTVYQLLAANQSFAYETVFLLAQARFEIAQLEIVGDIILIFELASFDELLSCIDQEINVISS
ncbi:chemotaxis protein CheC [Leptolyngbya sp. AN03gr2]|uniref:chemotaxis protein CheC n=1 Tax=unclassified Leptolyngbya TaxID=2650499 RepID=UPI003D31712A